VYRINISTGGGGGASQTTLVAGATVAEGDVLTVDISGDAVQAGSSFAADNWRVVGVALASVVITQVVDVSLAGSLVPVLFGTAPAAASNGELVYLSSTLGEATLTPPIASGNVVYIIGTLQGGDGADTTPDVLFQPQYLSRIP